MVLTITQKTFDEAVEENINILGLSPDESVTEAVNQFKAQGVDLTNIVTERGGSSDLYNVNIILEKLLTLKIDENSEEYVSQLFALKGECDKGIQYKIHAGRNGAYNVILNVLSKDNKELKITALKAMLALMSKQPDLLEDEGAQIIITHLDENDDLEVQKLLLRWTKECCVMHEMNRQKLFELNIVRKLCPILKSGQPEILKEMLSVLRALTRDDDVRVEFGRAHEHAKIIAEECLMSIVELLSVFENDELLINDLMLTISSLLVRTEFCKKVEEAEGIELIHNVMKNRIESEKVTRQSFKVLKALAGNDECKILIIQKGLAPTLSNSLDTHKVSIPTAAAGLGSIAALSLRCPDNSKALYEASIPEVIVEIMKIHSNEKVIQKTASWAIRNMVSRSRYQNKRFIELGVEEVLRNNLIKFREFEYDTKAALRDLECNVDLKEEWTGKGGKITSETPSVN